MTSILEDMEEMKRLTDEFLNKDYFNHEPTDIDEFRKLPDGTVKNTKTGYVEEPTTRQQDEIPDDLPSNNGRY